MSEQNQQTNYHAEVKGRLYDEEVRVNIFANTLNEIFLDIGKVHAQLFEGYRNPAKRGIANAEAVDQQTAALTFNNTQSGELPVCQQCGSTASMELIEFSDKQTGLPRKAWKCQACNKWNWPTKNGNGRGR